MFRLVRFSRHPTLTLASSGDKIRTPISSRGIAVRLLSLPLLLVLPAALCAQRTYTPGDIQEGGRVFRANCMPCHGPEGDQVPGIDFGHGKFRQTYSDKDLVKLIQTGIPRTGMPPNDL